MTVFDEETGDPLEDAIVKYRVGTGGMQECVSTEISHQFACGENEAGSLRIAVLKAGYTGEEKLIDVTMGPCHVNTETLEVRLLANE